MSKIKYCAEGIICDHIEYPERPNRSGRMSCDTPLINKVVGVYVKKDY